MSSAEQVLGTYWFLSNCTSNKRNHISLDYHWKPLATTSNAHVNANHERPLAITPDFSFSYKEIIIFNPLILIFLRMDIHVL